MACSLEEIKENALQKFVEHFNNLGQEDRKTLKRFDSKGRMEFNYLTSKKYTTEAAATKARQSIKENIEPLVEKWAEDTFGVGFSKGFLTNIKGTYPVLKFALPDYLIQAYNEKIKYEAIEEEKNRLKSEGAAIVANYNELIDEFQEADDFPMNTVNVLNDNIVQPNFNDYLDHKKKLLKNVDKTITRLYNDKRLHDSVEINKKITRFNYIKEALENDIKDFNKPIDRVELIKDYFEKDIATINELLSNPTLDNIFLAKSMFEYLERTKKSEAKEGDLFALKGKEKFAPDVEELIKDIELTLEDTKNKIEDTIDDVFLQLLEKNEDSLSKLYPGKSLVEIKDELLKGLQDINKIESFFFTQGTNLTSENNLIDQLIILEYKREKQNQNSKIQPIIQTINQAIPGIEAELSRLGKSFKFRNKNVYDYNWLYRKVNGVSEPQLISKFSKAWDKTISSLNRKYANDLHDARANKDWAEVERILKNKFNDLNDKAEFINIGLLHDLGDSEFQRGTSQEAANYKAELISKIGKEEYDRIIENQKNLLDKYKNEVNLIIQAKLADEDVTMFKDLSDNAKTAIENSIRRIDPMSFLDSFYSGNKGMVEINYGTQSDEKPSYLKFNTYIPKAQNNVGLDTGFYDSDFNEIENNPVMYDFWQKMRQGILLINENLVDSDLKLNYNSILNFKEGITKESLNKSFKTQLKEGLTWENFKAFFKDLVSAKQTEYNDSEYVQLAHQIKTVEGEVKKEHELIKTDVSNIINATLLPNTRIVWDSLSLNQKEEIIEVTGAKDESDFIDKAVTKGTFTAESLEVFAKIKVMDQQSLNLPAMVKGLLELSADHQARAASKNETNIYRMKSANILTAENGWHQRQGDIRENELKRQDFFYEKVILNKNQKDHIGNISKWVSNELGKNQFNGAEVGKRFYKNYTAVEKAIYNSAIQRIGQIDTEIGKTKSAAKLRLLEEEKAALAQRIDLLGKDYMLSALFDNIVNKLRVKVGLGYNILAGLNNYKQGFITTLNRDGIFWQRGNIYAVQHFIDLGSTRFVNPNYKKKWDLAKLFIEQLNIVETGTNELQKAEAEIKNRAGWMQPMFITEKVEYRNQAKGILAMAMDVEVEHATEKNPDGTPAKYPLFNGTDFVPYINDNGVLKLKPEFDTPANRSHFLAMDSKEISDWKLNVRAMNNSMNGDYTKEGVTRIKNSLFTRPLMTFKTWIPEYIGARWKYKQKNVLTGQEETGFMLSSLLNKKTSVTASLMLATTGALGAVTASPIIIAGFIASVGLGYGYTRYIASKSGQQIRIDSTEPIAMVQQAMYFLKMINPVALAEMPINTIFGKELIKPVEFKSEHNLTEQEKKDLRLMGRNMQHLALLMLVKIGIQAFLRDNEDDEPKGEIGTEQRAKYEAQKARRAEGHDLYNFLENQITGTFNESSFGTDPAAIWKAGSEGGIESQLKNIIKLGTSLFSPTEEIQKGPRQGQNKLGNALRTMFLPALFRGVGQDTYALGFESAMLSEWDKNEGFDGIFESDYKIDKKTAKEERDEQKADLIRQYEETNNVDYDTLTEEEQDDVDKIVKEQMKHEFDNPDRQQYDEAQELIEE